MISWHRVGQKVVTRNKVTKSGAAYNERWPVAGEVLTVREIVMHMDGTTVCFRFVEIVNTPKQWSNRFGESCFIAECFEPVYPQALDRLRGLLAPTLEEKRPFLEEIIADRVAGLPV